MVITSGGVSMGEYDLVKTILAELGTIDFWKVAMQPAKPFAFGHIDGTPLLGLPGNPVSVMVAFEQFARPALLHMMGCTAVFRPLAAARAAEGWRSDPAKIVFTRVVTEMVDGVVYARRSGAQMSNVLSSLARADAFAVVPVGTGLVEEGGLDDPRDVPLAGVPFRFGGARWMRAGSPMWTAGAGCGWWTWATSPSAAVGRPPRRPWSCPRGRWI